MTPSTVHHDPTDLPTLGVPPPSTWWGLLTVAATQMSGWGPVSPAATKAPDGHLCVARLFWHVLDPYAIRGEHAPLVMRRLHVEASAKLMGLLGELDLCRWDRFRPRLVIVGRLRQAAGLPPLVGLGLPVVVGFRSGSALSVRVDEPAVPPAAGVGGSAREHWHAHRPQVGGVIVHG